MLCDLFQSFMCGKPLRTSSGLNMDVYMEVHVFLSALTNTIFMQAVSFSSHAPYVHREAIPVRSFHAVIITSE